MQEHLDELQWDKEPTYALWKDEWGSVREAFRDATNQEGREEEKGMDVDMKDAGGSALIGNARGKIGREKSSVPGKWPSEHFLTTRLYFLEQF